MRQEPTESIGLGRVTVGATLALREPSSEAAAGHGAAFQFEGSDGESSLGIALPASRR